jgi:hypothetical protein
MLSSAWLLLVLYRNFVGFGKELFTDAGQYCIHFGYPAAEAAALQQRTLEARTGKQDLQVPEIQAGSSTSTTTSSDSSSSSSSSKDIAVIHTYTGNQLVSKGLVESIRSVVFFYTSPVLLYCWSCAASWMFSLKATCKRVSIALVHTRTVRFKRLCHGRQLLEQSLAWLKLAPEGP